LEFRGDSEGEGGTGETVAQVEELEASTAVKEEEGYGGREDDGTDAITGSRIEQICLTLLANFLRYNIAVPPYGLPINISDDISTADKPVP
jgi:hypothetical protein